MIWAQLRRCARMAATEDRAGDRTVTAPVPLTAGAGGRAPGGPVAPAGWTSAHAATGPIIPRRRSGSGPPGIPAGAPMTPHLPGRPRDAGQRRSHLPGQRPVRRPDSLAGPPGGPPAAEIVLTTSPRRPGEILPPRQDRAARCGSRKAEPAGSTPGSLTPARPGDPGRPRPARHPARSPRQAAAAPRAPRWPATAAGKQQAEPGRRSRAPGHWSMAHAPHGTVH
jgi:hypothetical protein